MTDKLREAIARTRYCFPSDGGDEGRLLLATLCDEAEKVLEALECDRIKG